MPARKIKDQSQLWLMIFVLLSLLTHALIFLLVVLIALFGPKPKLDLNPTANPSVSLELEPPPPKPLVPAAPPTPPPRPKNVFMPTQPDAGATPKPSPIISDNDTRLKSQSQKARAPDSVLPDVTAKNLPTHQLNDTQLSTQEQKPAAATPPTPPTPPQPPQPPAQQAPPQQLTTDQPVPPQDQPMQNPPTQEPTDPNSLKPSLRPLQARPDFDPNGLPVLPALNAPTLAPRTAVKPTPQNQTARTAQPPPNFQMSKADTSGSAGVNGEASPAAMATELGRYKAKIYRAVGSRWYAKVNAQLQIMPVGMVHITYTVHSDGRLEITGDPDANNAQVMLLHSISYQAMIEAAPFDAFSESMKRDVGESFTDDFTFSIYGG